MTTPLAGQTALVTGASRGIGWAIAQALAGCGARVALLARTASALAARVAALPAGALAVPCDLHDPRAVDAAVAAVRGAFGDIPDILVNNAGVFAPAPIEETTADAFAEAVQVNLVAAFALVRQCVPRMRERGHGHIVSIGSIADRTIFPGNAAYSASKFGLRALHDVLRAETRGTGIRATLVSPSSTDTPIWDPIGAASKGRFPPRDEMLPPSAVAAAVLFAVQQPERVNIDELRLTSS